MADAVNLADGCVVRIRATAEVRKVICRSVRVLIAGLIFLTQAGVALSVQLAFNYPSGFYESAFQLTISAPDDGVTIYYTTNGATPDPATGYNAAHLVKLSDIGPGLLLAATGIGVGDMVSSTIAGAEYGLTLIWALAAGVLVKFAITEGAARWQLTTGTTLLSNRGNALLRIEEDTCGRHDTLGGACSAESNTVRYALEKRHMHSCRDSFLLALARHPLGVDGGMTKRDLPSNINFSTAPPNCHAWSWG